jgi:CheY-like chemotaxis protein
MTREPYLMLRVDSRAGRESCMSDSPNRPNNADYNDPEAKRLGRLAHSMNNAIAYVVTNLNLLTEELEQLPLDAEQRTRILQLIDTSTEGATQVHLGIRRLKVLSWVGQQEEAIGSFESSQDDTWDEGPSDMRILIIDDEPQILRAIGRALQHYDLTSAESGQRAIELLSDASDYDLILCDLVMREVSGIDVFEWITEHRPELLDRLIFVTAGTFTDELRDFLASVPNQILNKPFDTKTLRWLVAQSVRRP